ncbi:hypothetical protein HH308_06345 [Gordonia sp. TBRC 11910]|uniref:Tail assembly chaperone n=1 Tax=Gordonia asplenii TaxID=2725283 RepID=A0A848KRF1_9ACTN|nr:hypothetical protein [Gordonia asplenii]NMO00832.1 hypothetical protein [Gordonia asplenii]
MTDPTDHQADDVLTVDTTDTGDVDPAENDLDAIPEELQFETGGDTERESIPITLDGMRTVLLQPSEGALMLSGNAWSEQVSDVERSHAIMTLINVCLDESGRRHLRQRMLDPTVDFDDHVLAKLLDAILTRWGAGVVPEKNRQQRREAARKGKRGKKK